MAVSTENDAEVARRLQQAEFQGAFGGLGYFGGLGSNINSSAQTQDDMSARLLSDANNPSNDNDNNGQNPLLNGNNDGNNNNDGDNANDNDINIGMDGAIQGQGGNNRGNNGNAAQRARRNVIGHVRDADTDSPRILLLRITIALLEIIATSTILAIGWNEGGSSSCGYLKWWVLIYTARHFITIPLRIHIYRINRQPNDPNNNDGDQQNNNAVIAEKSIQILRWLSIMTFLLFLLGQTFLFTEKTCQSTAPTVWYYCLVIIILVYVSLALPFLIVLAICICLPCVLIIFRFFAEPEGADDRIIKDLPTRKVKAEELHKKTEQTEDGNELQNGNTDNNEDDEDSDAPSCAICMQDYKVDDELRILPCKHEFHCECVDKWLPMKKICPLCRHDVTKKVQSPPNDNNNNNDNQQSNNNNNNDDNYNPLASNANSVNNNPLTNSSANDNNV